MYQIEEEFFVENKTFTSFGRNRRYKIKYSCIDLVLAISHQQSLQFIFWNNSKIFFSKSTNILDVT